MALEGLDASASLGALIHLALARGAQFPHLDRSVQATADKILAARRKCDTVDTVLVTVRAFQALDEMTRSDVPDADALVKRSSRDERAIRRDGDSSDAVFDGECEYARRALDIPESDGPVATARGDCTTIP